MIKNLKNRFEKHWLLKKYGQRFKAKAHYDSKNEVATV